MSRRITSARRAITLTGILAAGALLAACGGSSPDDAATGDATTPDGTATGEQVTGTVTLYAAASLQAAFTDLIAEFEAANPGITVEPPVYDGSSTLVTQLTEGADADVFASADEPNMDDLVAAGLNDGDPQLFASNTLVIAVAEANPLGITDLADLADVSYVVCAPEVPCGNATQQLFEAAGLSTDDAVSQEQNVTSVAERVASGEVDAGLVYATDVVTRSGELDAVVPEGADDVVNRYPIVTLQGADPAGAVFVDHVLSDDGQAVLAEYGFGAP
jgi:molybdate transport system substrate-binding protein